MKQRNISQRFRAVCVFFGALGAFLLLPQLAGAQTLSTKATAVNQNANAVSWKTSQQALPLLEQRINEIVNQLASLIPGTASYDVAKLRLDYFKTIQNNIQNGDSVAAAVTTATRNLEKARTLSQNSLFNEAKLLIGN